MPNTIRIAPCLWFDDQAEQAAIFYTFIFAESGIDTIARYGKEGFELHGRPEGSVMSVGFRLAGQSFTALNGGPHFQFNEAISLQVFCETQDELDYFWNRLSEGGREGTCGWLKDRFGLSWQVVPAALPVWMCAPDVQASQRVMRSFLHMKKLDLATLKHAFEAR